MQVKTRGIVLRTVKYGESQLIVDILTETHGVHSYMIYGARSARSKKKGLYTLTHLLAIEAVHHDNKKIQKIVDQDLDYRYESLPFDYMKMSTAVFMTELVSKVLQKTDADASTYDFVRHYLVFLDQTKDLLPTIHLHFMIHWVGNLGFEFDIDEGDWFPFFDLTENRFVTEEPSHLHYLGGEELKLFLALLATPLESLAELITKRGVRNALLDHLLTYYRTNISGMAEIKSHEVLRQIL